MAQSEEDVQLLPPLSRLLELPIPRDEIENSREQVHMYLQPLQLALGYGWVLYEYGTDSTCTAGRISPRLALTMIWLKPCPWDQEQMIPVGCVCCTNLDDELTKWLEELHSVMENHRLRKPIDPAQPLPDSPPVLGTVPSFLPPYRAR